MHIDTVAVPIFHDMERFCEIANEAVNKRSDELQEQGFEVLDIHVNTYSKRGGVHFVYTIKYK